MQESQVGWDPMYEPSGLPWGAELFLLYLLLVLAVSFVRSVSLLWQLRPLPVKPRSAGAKTDSETRQTDLLARLALANRLPRDHSGSSPTILQEATSEFAHRCELCAAKVSSIKKLVPLTLLVSILLLVESSATMLGDIATEKRVWIGFVAGRTSELLVQMALGVLVCVILYAISSSFEGALARRKISWNYFVAKARNQHHSE
jgi:hypothetical protein